MFKYIRQITHLWRVTSQDLPNVLLAANWSTDHKYSGSRIMVNAIGTNHDYNLDIIFNNSLMEYFYHYHTESADSFINEYFTCQEVLLGSNNKPLNKVVLKYLKKYKAVSVHFKINI